MDKILGSHVASLGYNLSTISAVMVGGDILLHRLHLLVRTIWRMLPFPYLDPANHRDVLSVLVA